MQILTLVIVAWILGIWAVTLLFLAVFLVGSETLRNGGKKEKYRRRKRFYPYGKNFS